MNETLILILAALLVGFAKSGLPLGALIAPLVATVMPVSQTVGLILPLLMVGDVFALRAYWGRWDRRHVRLLLPAAVVGIVAGALLLTSLPDIVLRRLLGIFTLVIVAYKLASDRLRGLRYEHRDWHGILAGGSAGFTSALANAGGPPITAYLLLQELDPVPFVGTSVLFFAIANALKFPIFLGTGVIDLPYLLHMLWMVVLIPPGVWAGHWIIQRVNQRVFEWIMLIFLIYAGVSLLVG